LAQPNGPNFRNEPIYFMGRLTKSLNFNDIGLSVDFGVSARFGNISASSATVIESDKNSKGADANSIKVGDAVARNWFGGELQIYYDIPMLGGMKLLTEYTTGSSVDEPAATAPIRKRDFSGFYVMFVKNIMTEWQIAVKYDKYTPNTKIDEKDIIDTKDLSVNTLGFGIHNYSFDNVRISLWYDMNHMQTSNNDISAKLDGSKLLYPTDLPKNLMTARIQYKF
jgi:hypothetical protein